MPFPFKTLLLFMLILQAGLPSCKKATDENADRTGLAGGWTASDYIADPGNGDTSWHPFSRDSSDVITFDNSGKGSIYSNGVKADGYYQSTSDSTMDIIGGAFPTSVSYRVNGDTLFIYGRCIEACATRYFRTGEL